MPLEFEFHLQFPYGSLMTELSDFSQTTRSGNECNFFSITSGYKHNCTVTVILENIETDNVL